MSCDTKNKIAIFMTNINDYEYYREFKETKLAVDKSKKKP